MYLPHTPRLVQKLLPALIWRLAVAEPKLYLTFDDGPHPDITPWVYDVLRAYDAKGTFFCVGANLDRYHGVFDRGLAEGHSFGNHTYNHLMGWTTKNDEYFRDVQDCNAIYPFSLFRPPHGYITLPQIKRLRTEFRIVMWDVLSGDFHNRTSPGRCLDNVLSNSKPGSVVVFHDSIKAEKNLRYSLPKVLEYYSNAGYMLEGLPKDFAVPQRIATAEAEAA